MSIKVIQRDLIFELRMLDTNILVASFDTKKDSKSVINLLNTKYSSDIEELVSEDQWTSISQTQFLDVEFMRKYINKLNIRELCIYQELNKELIYLIEKLEYSRFGYNNNWFYICVFQQISEEIIKNYQSSWYICWYEISRCQKLSQEYMIELIYRDPTLLDLIYICKHQEIGEELALVLNQKLKTILQREIDSKIDKDKRLDSFIKLPIVPVDGYDLHIRELPSKDLQDRKELYEEEEEHHNVISSYRSYAKSWYRR